MFSDAPTMLEWQQSWAVKADLLIAISESTRRDAVEFLGAAPERTVTVPLGVSTAPVGDEPRTASQLLYVGSRAGYKNWRALVEAMASPALREATLVCAGGGPFTPAEVELLGAHGLRPRVQVRDVSDTELTRLYRRSAALVYPSLYEGFGLPPLEAMANGCPVIATDAGSVGEVVGDAACVIDPADPASLADGIERVLGDDAYRQALSARGERRAALFTWSRTAELTSNCYRTLAG
jgi:glycosyltransferase involved in cell wall biosynthesis